MPTNSLLILVMTLSFVLLAHGQKAEEKVKSEFVPISDVDFSHLESPAQFFWGIDPFFKHPGFSQIDAEAASPLERIELQAIIYDKEAPMAIVNGLSVSQGDMIEDFVIERIGVNYLVVRGEGMVAEVKFAAPKSNKTTTEKEFEKMISGKKEIR